MPLDPDELLEQKIGQIEAQDNIEVSLVYASVCSVEAIFTRYCPSVSLPHPSHPLSLLQACPCPPCSYLSICLSVSLSFCSSVGLSVSLCVSQGLSHLKFICVGKFCAAHLIDELADKIIENLQLFVVFRPDSCGQDSQADQSTAGDQVKAKCRPGSQKCHGSSPANR